MSKVSALMDYTKIQTEIIKEYEKKPRKYMYGIHERESIWQGIAIDGHVIVFIPDCMYVLDNSKVFRDQTPLKFENMINENECKPLVLTNELIMLDGKSINVLKNSDENEIFVNSKFLEIFTKTGIDINYKGTGPKAPVYVYSHNDLIGLICPINYQR